MEKEGRSDFSQAYILLITKTSILNLIIAATFKL